MTFCRTSYCGITFLAKLLAMQGKSAKAIADELDIHIVAARWWVEECREHREAFKAAAERRSHEQRS